MSKQTGDDSAFGVAAGSGITLHLVLTHHWFEEPAGKSTNKNNPHKSAE